MRNAVDIDVQIDPNCADPQIIIRASRMTPEIDAIVHAIENCTGSVYPTVPAYDGDTMVLLSQRDIVRVYVESRRLIVRTEYPQIPPKVEYTLTERGHSLVAVLDKLCDWGIENRPE